MSGWSHELVFAPEPESASKVRDFVAEHLVAHGLAHLVEDAQLVGNELATNALVHAQTAFTVTLTSMDGVVLLVIRDGSGSLPVRSSPRATDVGGRGLVLVEMLSHEWGASRDDSGSKSVWASFATHVDPGPARTWT
ncbi:ATP-binding protein [Nocardioides iriomotensis]|uniref:ATP-binding protein n=1 Tax=Nocardioides iriomotensis TaxID=715784 RepID=A0A4Q5IXM4_9ACTN|nr:ATP-binding protein [Nocardioides iriomotensis]RYU10713.1 ATP-binding protein [Nocardioides iriomotensis]